MKEGAGPLRLPANTPRAQIVPRRVALSRFMPDGLPQAASDHALPFSRMTTYGGWSRTSQALLGRVTTPFIVRFTIMKQPLFPEPNPIRLYPSAQPRRWLRWLGYALAVTLFFLYLSSVAWAGDSRCLRPAQLHPVVAQSLAMDGVCGHLRADLACSSVHR